MEGRRGLGQESAWCGGVETAPGHGTAPNLGMLLGLLLTGEEGWDPNRRKVALWGSLGLQLWGCPHFETPPAQLCVNRG